MNSTFVLFCLIGLSCLQLSQQWGDFCELPPETGPCKAGFMRWAYNPHKKMCWFFTYGGCLGNKNNFKSRDECINACGDVCSLPLDVGMCKAAVPRFYYDKASWSCKKFIYGGCGGNGNQFKNLKDCTAACGWPQENLFENLSMKRFH